VSSKFGDLLRTAKGREPEPQPTPPAALPSPAPPLVPRKGRPPGKRSDPRFVQVTAYVPESLHRKVKIRLLQEAEVKEFSELIEELLEDWVDSRS
jgi:hypothetical protein